MRTDQVQLGWGGLGEEKNLAVSENADSFKMPPDDSPLRREGKKGMVMGKKEKRGGRDAAWLCGSSLVMYDVEDPGAAAVHSGHM